MGLLLFLLLPIALLLLFHLDRKKDCFKKCNRKKEQNCDEEDVFSSFLENIHQNFELSKDLKKKKCKLKKKHSSCMVVAN